MANGNQVERLIRADFRGGINPAWGPSQFKEDEWTMLENVVLTRSGRLLPQGDHTTGWANPDYDDAYAIVRGYNDRWVTLGFDSANGEWNGWISGADPELDPGGEDWFEITDFNNKPNAWSFDAPVEPKGVAGPKYLQNDSAHGDTSRYFETTIVAKDGAIMPLKDSNNDPQYDNVSLRPPDTYFPNNTTENGFPKSRIAEFWQDTLVHARIRWRDNPDSNLSSTNASWYPNGIWFSEPAAYYTYDGLNVLLIGTPKPIIDLIPIDEGLVILKEDGVWMLQGSPGDYRLQPIQGDRGVVDGTRWADAAVWVTERGEVWGTRTGDTRMLFDGFSVSSDLDDASINSVSWKIMSDAGYLLLSVVASDMDSWLAGYAGFYLLQPVQGRSKLSATKVDLAVAHNTAAEIRGLSSKKGSDKFMTIIQVEPTDQHLQTFHPVGDPDPARHTRIVTAPLSQGVGRAHWERVTLHIAPGLTNTNEAYVEAYRAYDGTFHETPVIEDTSRYQVGGVESDLQYAKSYRGHGAVSLATFEFETSGLLEIDGIELEYRNASPRYD